MSAPVRSWRAELVCLHALLLRRRADLGLTQQDLADQLGVKVLTVKRWESSRSNPSSKTLWRWADALGVTITPSVREVSRNDTLKEAA